jgi:hypothetical protein
MALLFAASPPLVDYSSALIGFFRSRQFATNDFSSVQAYRIVIKKPRRNSFSQAQSSQFLRVMSHFVEFDRSLA